MPTTNLVRWHNTTWGEYLARYNQVLLNTWIASRHASIWLSKYDVRLYLTNDWLIQFFRYRIQSGLIANLSQELDTYIMTFIKYYTCIWFDFNWKIKWWWKFCCLFRPWFWCVDQRTFQLIYMLIWIENEICFVILPPTHEEWICCSLPGVSREQALCCGS